MNKRNNAGLSQKDYVAIGESEEVVSRSVPCGTCQECCKNDAIFIHPETGDNPADFKTVPYKGRLILDHKTNGDCIYLNDSGCSIHGKAPTVCKEFDCRTVMLNSPQVYKAMMSKSMIKAAKKQLKLLTRQIANKKRLAKLEEKQEKNL